MSGRANLKEFIEKYKELECLWRITDKNYKNKYVRLNALEQLLQIMLKIDPNANIDTVTKKINALRSSFHKEYNKVKASYQSRIGNEDVHIPKLWYYQSLLFLTEKHFESRDSSDAEAVLSESSTDSQDINTEIEHVPNSKRNILRSSTNTRLVRKRRLENTHTEERAETSRRMKRLPQAKLPFTAFGEHVAEKLRLMDGDAAIYCQKIICDAIFNAELNNLNYSSRIVTDHLQDARSPFSQTRSLNQTPSPLHGALSPQIKPQTPQKLLQLSP